MQVVEVAAAVLQGSDGRFLLALNTPEDLVHVIDVATNAAVITVAISTTSEGRTNRAPATMPPQVRCISQPM